jgi:hypothetical protein
MGTGSVKQEKCKHKKPGRNGRRLSLLSIVKGKTRGREKVRKRDREKESRQGKGLGGREAKGGGERGAVHAEFATKRVLTESIREQGGGQVAQGLRKGQGRECMNGPQLMAVSVYTCMRVHVCVYAYVCSCLSTSRSSSMNFMAGLQTDLRVIRRGGA